MSSCVRQGVILAAGRGTRLHPLSLAYPKPLRPICNKPIMQYQIEAMRAAGITDIGIVIGATGAPIRACFGDGSRLGVQISYVEDHAPAGIAASLACVEPWVHGPFMVFLGDIFLALDDLTPALAPLDNGAAGTIIVRRDASAAVQRNFAVVTDERQRVITVIEKPKVPPTNLKGCGVYVFDQTIFEAIRRTPRSALRNEYELTDAIQTLIDFDKPVVAADVVRWDLNITFPEDLLLCNLRVLRERGISSLIGSGARFNREVQLISSVVGDDALIDASVCLEECLVLPGARIADVEGTKRRHIFSSDMHLSYAADQT